MKKFTKVCLVTAGVLFVIGCILCGSFGAMGGFSQINSHIGWLDYDFFGFLDSVMYGDWDVDHGEVNNNEELTVIEEVIDEGNNEMYNIDKNNNSNSDNYVSDGDLGEGYAIDDISNIDIQLGGEELILENSPDDHIYVKDNTESNRISYGKDGSTFRIYSKNKKLILKNRKRGNVYVYLPENMALSSIDMEVGAGKFNSMALKADEISIDIGAGEAFLDEITAREVDISVGAGEVNINAISADEADISVGAGNVTVDGMDIGDASLEVGMGNITANGLISKDIDADCSMGSIKMTIAGNETDYNYSLDCAMGSIIISGRKYGGFASEKTINNGGSRNCDLDCAMGTITVNFE